jgi:hypothetical protein
MAVGVEGYDRPELKLTPAECADVLYSSSFPSPWRWRSAFGARAKRGSCA